MTVVSSVADVKKDRQKGHREGLYTCPNTPTQETVQRLPGLAMMWPPRVFQQSTDVGASHRNGRDYGG
jgi:hypothetical protein